MGELAPDLAELERALAYAHRAIARREQTVAQVRALLERRGVAEATADLAVEELVGTGLLDDARFARRFAGDKRDLEQWGSTRIARELDRRGRRRRADRRGAWRESGRQDELDTARVLLERRWPQAPRDDRERDRAWRLLVRRGYEPELAYEAVREHERTAGRAAPPDRARTARVARAPDAWLPSSQAAGTAAVRPERKQIAEAAAGGVPMAPAPIPRHDRRVESRDTKPSRPRPGWLSEPV